MGRDCRYLGSLTGDPLKPAMMPAQFRLARRGYQAVEQCPAKCALSVEIVSTARGALPERLFLRSLMVDLRLFPSLRAHLSCRRLHSGHVNKIVGRTHEVDGEPGLLDSHEARLPQAAHRLQPCDQQKALAAP